MSAKGVLSQEDKDSLAELFNIAFGAAGNRISSSYDRHIKLIHPTVDVVPLEQVEEMLAMTYYIHKTKSKNFHRGCFIFVLEKDTVKDLVSFILGAPSDPSDPSCSEKVISVMDTFINEIKEISDASLSTAIGKDVAFDSGVSGFFDVAGLDLSSEYQEDMAEVKIKFSVEGVLKSQMYVYIPVNFALSLNSNFMQAVDVQVSEFVPVWSDTTEADQEKLKTMILHCQREGNFALVEDLNVDLKVQIVSRRMRMRDLWALKHGSLLEFKKNHKEVVDVKFGDMRMAVADVIVIKDKFGVKIKEIKR